MKKKLDKPSQEQVDRWFATKKEQFLGIQEEKENEESQEPKEVTVASFGGHLMTILV